MAAHAGLPLEFADDPRTLTVGNAAAGLLARSVAYSAKNLLNGFVPAGWAKQAGTSKERKALVESGWWVEEKDGYRIDGFHATNLSAEQVQRIKEANAENARKRWHNDASGDADGNANRIADGKRTAMPLSLRPYTVVRDGEINTSHQEEAETTVGKGTSGDGRSDGTHQPSKEEVAELVAKAEPRPF
jgi:hypothetical protein